MSQGAPFFLSPPPLLFFFFFFFNDTATTEIYPLPLHDALPIKMTFPVMFITPPLAMASGPASVPAFQVNVPVTVISQVHTAALQAHMEIPSLFLHASPTTTLPPAKTRLGGTLWVRVRVPPVNSV